MSETKEWDLSEEEVEKIQNTFVRMTAVKNLIKEMGENDNEFVFDKLLSELSNLQLKYDTWFSKLQAQHNITVTPQNKWNVDFENKKLQLL